MQRLKWLLPIGFSALPMTVDAAPFEQHCKYQFKAADCFFFCNEQKSRSVFQFDAETAVFGTLQQGGSHEVFAPIWTKLEADVRHVGDRMRAGKLRLYVGGQEQVPGAKAFWVTCEAHAK